MIWIQENKMDIFEYAMQMEKDGEEFYRTIADNTTDKALKAIVTMLADDEVKHFQTISQMKAGSVEMAETRILNNAKNIFAEIKDSEQSFNESSDQIDLYKQAREIEEKSQNFYAEKAAESANQNHRQILNLMADEEQKHFNLLSTIIDFLSRPKQWLENAEWNHLEEY